MALAIDLASSSGTNDEQSPLIFTTLMDDIEVIAEKLKFAVSNAKSAEVIYKSKLFKPHLLTLFLQPESVQTTYDVLHSLSAAVNKNKSANNQKTVIKTSASPVAPVRSASDITSNGPTISLHSSSSASSLLEPVPTKSTDPKKKSKTPRKYSAPVQPKSGALAAAMMAASVAGGSGFLEARKGIQEESRNILRNKRSKATLVHHEDGDVPVPMPNSTIASINSSTVNIPSKLADIVTLETAATKAEDRKFTLLKF